MRKKLITLGLILVTCINITACGGMWSSSLGDGGYYEDYDSYSEARASYNAVSDGAGVAGYGEETGYNSVSVLNANAAPQVKTESTKKETSSTKENNTKLIRDVELTVEIDSSANLEESVNSLIELTESYNGWVAYNNVDYASRYAGGLLELRIPQDNVDKFIETVENDEIRLRSKSDSTEDVTMQYVDAQSRLKVKLTQRDKYMQYLEQATNTTELLEIEDRLALVIADIESYEEKLRMMDSLIEYTEVSIKIQCETSIDRQSFGERFKRAITDIRESVADTFLGGMEWFLNALIVLIFVIPIGIISIRSIVFAISGNWKWKRKNKDGNEKNKADKKSLKEKLKSLLKKKEEKENKPAETVKEE